MRLELHIDGQTTVLLHFLAKLVFALYFVTTGRPCGLEGLRLGALREIY